MPDAVVIAFPTKTKVYAAPPDLLDLCWVCQVNTAEHDESGLCEGCR